MKTRYAIRLLVLAICLFGTIASCTAVLGVDTDYNENPCSAGDLPALKCGVGACTVLTEACQNGLPVECTPGNADGNETCDNIDNNCDGIVDEGCSCVEGTPDKPLTQVCYTGSPVTRGLGDCHDGVQTCVNSIWSQCVGDQLPEPETNDKLDNNCNGKVDEGFSCAEGQEQPCYGGPGDTRNVTPCKDGKQKCQGGKWGECIGDIVPALEVCNGSDDNCDGFPDDGCACVDGEEQECYSGPADTKGVGACKAGTQKCVKGLWGKCQGEVLAKAEFCDGVDNDCNAKTDDGDFVGIPELCDSKDNNCNGQIDEGNPGGGVDCDTGKAGPCGAGTTSCANGTVTCKQKVQSFPESCDGLDNDCDGASDNGNPGSGSPCTVPNLVGTCAVGTENCQGGQIICKQTVTPTPEGCNGKDDDCDGQTDEGNPGSGGPCTVPNKLGACSAGVMACSNGAPVCQQQVFPTPNELCDNIDNDCDGQTDEGNPGSGGPCTVPGAQGQCASGQVACLNGALSCMQTVAAAAESCNGKDDNCDGTVDDGNPGGGGTCPVQGQNGVCAVGALECLNAVLGCKQTATPSPETCDGKDNDCNGQLDEGSPGGGLGCTTGKAGVCANGTTACTGGVVVCNQNIQSSPETCDGQDNDCDGIIDDGNPGGGAGCSTGNPGVCGAGTTACQNGAIACTQNNQSSAEQCDGLDNNCNGQVDEGNPGGGGSCTTQQPGVCSAGTFNCQNGALVCKANLSASPEVCDNIDNNCDGIVDNGNPGGGLGCTTNKPGICSQGTTTCASGAIVCQQNQQSSNEICDGVDNDCNGIVDNGNPGGDAACTTPAPGVCSAGLTKCQNGSLTCTQTSQAAAESCDGLDNDCNGSVDNGNPGGGINCTTGLPGICNAGTTKCQGGAVVCTSNLNVTSEICDGLDNNCDGSIDNGNPGGGMACSVPTKQGLCAAGSTVCSSGAITCQQVTFPVAETCDNKDNDCDGVIDNGNPGSGMGCPVPNKQGLCAQGLTTCSSGAVLCTQVSFPSAETCDSKDNDCDGVVDNGNPGSGFNCAVVGQQGVCAAGKTTCSGGATVCSQTVQPSSEVCDQLDNNCDGMVDNGNPGGGLSCSTGNPGVCGAGTTACQNGAVLCTQNVQPSAEQCDNLDNSCNGLVDEGDPGGNVSCSTGLQGACGPGTKHCVMGALACQQNAQPSAETCDGNDNDCDGVTDEGNPGGGGACTVAGKLGECAKGINTCTAGALACTQVNFPAAMEICDGKDNNCDGQTDEDDPGGNVACSTGNPGVCGSGTKHCVSGALACQQNVASSPETCDGLDNNCNGTSDEGDPGGNVACSTGNPGVCGSGTKHCVSGALACQQNAQPSAEICDSLDNNCDGQTDEGDPGGNVVCSTGNQGVCGPGTKHCVSGALACQQNVASSPEQCDNLDNNCNGQTDEGDPGGNVACSTGNSGVCGAGTKHCVSGALACQQNVLPSAETCDGNDNDCDGVTDEGNPQGGGACTVGGQLGECAKGTNICTAGSIVCTQTISPTMELCDGLDNDCDNQSDEGDPGGGGACSTGSPGVCGPGTNHCVSGALACQPNVPSSAETCDGNDNDCDGQTDEGNPQGGGACAVGGQFGECAKGTNICTAGSIVCTQTISPTMELCDGLDNDCDNQSDEGDPGGGGTCSTGNPGVCGPGTKHCVMGALACQQDVLSSAETCDTLDNDCDGVADEGNPGGGAGCTTGQAGVCSPGTQTCVNGMVTCTSNVTPSAEVCDNLDNNCNGVTDEGAAGGTCVVAGQNGECANGTEVCTLGIISCSQTTFSTAELCDGLDNDCDNQIDEGDPGSGGSCATGQPGVCGPGTSHCVMGALACQPNVTPSAETCDTLDNNCNGTADEGNPGGGTMCMSGQPGICAPGMTMCMGGSVICKPNLMPATELCDPVDQDCDGLGSVFFMENFSSPAAGWVSNNWAFGVAAGGCATAPDPTDDHTPDPNMDKKIAGVGISLGGGCVASNASGELTSPPITITAGSPVHLQFARWLRTNANLDNKIQFNDNVNATWRTVYDSTGAVTDTTWQKISIPLTPVDPAATSVTIRWTYSNSGSNGSQGGWSIDDVAVTNEVCTF